MSLSPRLLTFVMAAWKALMTGRDSVEKAVRSAVKIPCLSSIFPRRVIRRPCWSVDGCELPDCGGLVCGPTLLQQLVDLEFGNQCLCGCLCVPRFFCHIEQLFNCQGKRGMQKRAVGNLSLSLVRGRSELIAGRIEMVTVCREQSRNLINS